MSSSFHLTSNERKGAIGLLILIVIIASVRAWQYNSIQLTIEKAEQDLENLELVDSVPLIKDEKRLTMKPKALPVSLFAKQSFNPNDLSIEEWEEVGLPPKIAARTFTFLNAGKGIQNPNDLLKIYGWKEKWLLDIKDSIKFPEVVIEINSLSAIDFSKINGIGETLSRRTIKFRELLGGFYSINQLYSVYGMDSVVVGKASKGLVVDKSLIRRIEINRAGLADISAHPYITEQQAYEIIALRSLQSKLDSLDLINIFPNEEWEKIKYYLKWKD